MLGIYLKEFIYQLYDFRTCDDIAKLPIKTEIKEEIVEGIFLEQMAECQRFPCEICGEMLPTSVEFAIHSYKLSTDERFYCHHCNYSVKDKRSVKKHMLSHGNDGKFYHCEKCSEKFNESIQALEHKYYHNGETPNECSDCQKKFMFSWLLLTHRRLLHSENERQGNSKCEICNLTFRTVSSLSSHYSQIHKQHDRSQYVCNICGNGYVYKRSLQNHIKTHGKSSITA